jgi:hypothetical protein
MKLLVKFIAVAGFMAFTSGCSTTSNTALPTMEGGVCNNPKCQCPKPCQCGADCQCGMNGNSTAMEK